MKDALRRVNEVEPVPDLERALRLYDLLARTAAVGARTTCLDDYVVADDHPKRVLHDRSDTPWYRAPLDARMDVFAETAAALARDAFAADVEAPDVLVQVSCTGYDSPTAVQRVAVAKEWTRDTRVLHLGHMGCYAALPAAALAADMVQMAAPAGGVGDDADSRAAIFLVELCTLHHDPATTDAEQIVQQCLFADGAARLDVTAAPRPGSFALLDYQETILPDTPDAMTWRVADTAFRMTLRRTVPTHVRDHLAPVAARLLGRHGLAVDDVRWWAVHPGGPRVIESAAEALGLGEDAVRHSRSVLHARGNMSSATLPHIWTAMAEDEAVESGDFVVSVAFGPGLTVAANLMQVV